MNRKIRLLAHNIRSAHNVGSLLRTADGLGVEQVYLTGYSPYPAVKDDPRLPHLRQKISRQIHKTALGAEDSVPWEYAEDPLKTLKSLEGNFYRIALEQTGKATELSNFKTDKNVLLIIGNEVNGLENSLLQAVDDHLKISMLGSKESFNVVVAAAIALYHLRFMA